MKSEMRTSILFPVMMLGLLVLGISPFSCENRAVNQAGELIVNQFEEPLVAAKSEAPVDATDSGVPTAPSEVSQDPEAVVLLNGLGIDQPEVYLAKTLAFIADGQWEAARKAADHAYALVAQAQAKSNAEGEAASDPAIAGHRAQLRSRIAFALGRIAIAQERFSDAIVEFGRVLREFPDDEDARWNLELAWHMENPNCLKRDDDHEPDDSQSESRPYDPEKGSERLLCPNDEDWYSFATEQKGGGIFATVKGKVVQYDGDETREPELMMIDASSGTILMQASLDDESLKVGQRTLGEGGEFYFALRGPGTGEFAYEIAVEEVPPCTQLDDDHEPDNTPSEAKPINQGQHEKRMLCPDDQDWYLISGEKEMDLYIRIRGEIKTYLGSEKRQLQMVLFGPDGQVPLRESRLVDGELRIGMQGLPEDGNYVFGIGGPGDGEFTYDMDIVVTPPCPVDDAREENDEPNQAYALKDETPASSQPQAPQMPGAPGGQGAPDEGFKGLVGNLKACPGDKDYFTLTVPAQTETQVSAMYDVKRAPLDFRLLKDGDQVVDGSESKDGRTIRLEKVEQEVTYTFLVQTASDKENNYVIKWEPPGEDGDDQNQQNNQPEDGDQSQNNDQQQNSPPPQPEGLSGDDLLDALDKQERNPQLEKALRDRRVIPDLEDF